MVWSVFALQAVGAISLSKLALAGKTKRDECTFYQTFIGESGL